MRWSICFFSSKYRALASLRSNSRRADNECTWPGHAATWLNAMARSEVQFRHPWRSHIKRSFHTSSTTTNSPIPRRSTRHYTILMSSPLDLYEPLDIIGNGSFGIIRKVRRKSDGMVGASSLGSVMRVRHAHCLYAFLIGVCAERVELWENDGEGSQADCGRSVRLLFPGWYLWRYHCNSLLLFPQKHIERSSPWEYCSIQW